MADESIDLTGGTTPPSRGVAVLKMLAALRPALPPSPALASLAMGGTLAEALLISSNRPSLYSADWMTVVFGLLYLVWFWVTLAWICEVAGRSWRRGIDQARIGGKCFGWLALGLLVTLLVGYYAVSWVLFFQTGRFANLETGRFVFFNFAMIVTYLFEAEPLQLLLAVSVATLALVGLPALLYLSVARTPNRTAEARRVTVLAWVTLWLVLTTTWTYLDPLPSKLQQSVRLHALKHGLNPVFSLYASHVENTMVSPVRPTLEVAQLQPLAEEDLTRHVSAPAKSPPPSIIFVAIESLRHDVIHQFHQGKEVLPNINRLAHGGMQLTRAYAQSTHSDYSDICLVSSLYPLRTQQHHYYKPSDPWPATRIYDVLKGRGYATAIISSQNESWGGMSHFLASPHLDLFYHPETGNAKTLVDPKDPGFAQEVATGGLLAGKFPDAHTADRAIAWIQEQTRAGKPFFLSMNFQSSHFPYLMPPEVPRPFAPYELSAECSFINYPRSEVETVRNAYFNGVHECDRQVGRLVDALESLGQLENTILVVTGENGEAFYECNLVTHARDPIEPVIHVACILHAPNCLPPSVEDYPFEHVDLVPTVLGLAGLPSHPNFQGIDILAHGRPPADMRLTFCHVKSSLSEADVVMLGARWKLTVDRRNSKVTLHDVLNDPLQSTDLMEQQPALAQNLHSIAARWREQQLAYYHFPAYYLQYYPPRPPEWSVQVTRDGSGPPDRNNGAAKAEPNGRRLVGYATLRSDQASNASSP